MKALGTFLITLCMLNVHSGQMHAEAALPLAGQFVRVDRSVLEKKKIAVTSRALKHYLTGLIYDNYGQTEEAVSEYSEALRFLPDQASVLTRKGAGLLIQGDTAQGLDYLHRAIEASPQKLEPYLLTAIVHASSGEYNKAEKYFRGALKSDPENVKVLTMLADMKILQKDLKGAVEIYERLVEVERKPLVYFNLGVLYTKLKELEDAAQSMQKAVELDESYLEAQMMLGHIYQIDGKYNKAIEQYKRVLRIDPLYTDAYGRLAQIYHQHGMHEKALEQNRTMMKIAPDDPQSYLRISSIYLSLDMHDQAREVLTKAVDRGLHHPAIYSSLGYIAASEQDIEAAEKYYRTAIEIAGSEADVWRYYLASIFFQEGEEDKAVEELETFIDLEDGDVMPRAFNLLGYIYVERGENLDRAIALIQKAVETDPENGAYLDSLGWAYYKKGQISKALEYIERAVELLPNETIIIEHYATVLEEAGRLEEALEYWQQVLERDQGNEESIERIRALERELQR